MLERVQQLQRLIDSKKSEIMAIRAKADAENRQLNGEEAAKVQSFLADLEGYQVNLDLCKREAMVNDKLNKPANEPTKPFVGIDELQAKYPGLAPKGERYDSLGEQLVDVARAKKSGGVVTPKLARLRAAAGMSEGVPSDGGFLVQTDQAAGIKTRMYSTGAILSRVTRLPISSNSNSITIPIAADATESGGIFGGILAYWLAEAGTKSVSHPTLEALTLKLKKLAVVVPTTDELLQDAVALEAFIRIGANKALVKEAEKQIIRGVGAGQPLGILNSGCLVTVSKEVGQLADTIVYENICNMWSRMYADSRPNSVWLINASIEPQLFNMGITVGTGGSPVYLPPGGASASPYGTLFGRPVVPCNYCSKLGDVGDIILADFSEYLVLEKGGVQETISVDYAFITDETYYRFVMRVDGQPAWRTVFTPEQATTATQSPFVTLEAR